MKLRHKCPACQSQNPEPPQSPPPTTRAIISPWIRDLTGIRERYSKYIECNACQSGYFSLEYEKREMSDIYGDYRSPTYTATRSRWEPWYSQEWNAQVSFDQHGAKQRRETLRVFLLSQGNYFSPDSSTKMCVVDIGGDVGQFIPFGARRYVIDVSGRQLAPNVMRVQSLSDIDGVDLVICAHLLEHVPDPVEEIRSYVKAPLIYLEVPFGVPIGSTVRDRTALMLGWLARIPSLYKFTTNPAAGRRQKKSIWSAMIRQSEHINFFSVSGITSMAALVKREVLVVEIADTWTPDGAQSKVIRALLA